jgi:hypothetical protein
MRILRVGCVAFMLLCSLVAAKAETTEWQPLLSKEGGFRVLMPGTPDLTKAIHRSVVGTVHEYTYTGRTERGVYSASYSGLPGVAVNLGGAQFIFDRARKGLLEDVNGVETGVRDTSIGGHVGKELSFRTRPVGETKATIGRARFYLVSKMLYVVVGRSSSPNDADIPKFLNSFQLASS